MTSIFKNLNISFFIVVTFFLSGCLKDEDTPVFETALAENATLLFYLEDHGDYINSASMPSIVDVDELYNNLNNYLVIDTRTNTEFIVGHIEGAINIQNDSLISYINSIDINQYSKVVLVSSDGQASSYYTSLLKLYGFSNIYSLLFGMTEWNGTFSDAWANNVGDSPAIEDFRFGNYIPDSSYNLPNISISGLGKNLEEQVKNRIENILKIGFVSDETYVAVDPVRPISFNGENAANFFIVCFGDRVFYIQNGFDDVSVGHFPDAVSFVPEVTLKSTESLQILPDKRKIAVYSYSGQISAFVVAYLRVLGYDAKSILYGANGIFYTYMVNKYDFYSPFVYIPSDVRNYPYVAGSSPE